MTNFKDLGIKTEAKGFEGDKIKVERILNKEIQLIDYKTVASKYPEKGNGKCLYMQITIDGSKRVVFTGSIYLQDTIDKIPKDKFPITTTIVKIDERLEFT